MIPPPGTPGAPSRHARARARHRMRGLHAEVVNHFGRLIVTSDPESEITFVPDDLAEHFEVSRTVIREAFRSLESKGLIAARPNVGTYVRPVHEWNLLDPDIIEWRAFSPQAVRQRSELRELRWIVDTLATRLAATTREPQAWALLAAAVVDMDDALHRDQADMFAKADARFHQRLIRAADSLMLNHLSQTVTHGLTACAEVTTYDRTQATVTHHQAVVHALRTTIESSESSENSENSENAANGGDSEDGEETERAIQHLRD